MNPGYIPPSLFQSLLEVERGLQLSGQRFFNTKERIPGGNSRAHGASAHQLSIAELKDVLAQKRKNVGLDVESWANRWSTPLKIWMVINARC